MPAVASQMRVPTITTMRAANLPYFFICTSDDYPLQYTATGRNTTGGSLDTTRVPGKARIFNYAATNAFSAYPRQPLSRACAESGRHGAHRPERVQCVHLNGFPPASDLRKPRWPSDQRIPALRGSSA